MTETETKTTLETATVDAVAKDKKSDDLLKIDKYIDKKIIWYNRTCWTRVQHNELKTHYQVLALLYKNVDRLFTMTEMVEHCGKTSYSRVSRTLWKLVPLFVDVVTKGSKNNQGFQKAHLFKLNTLGVRMMKEYIKRIKKTKEEECSKTL